MPKVCFITLSRSDYTSTKPVIKAAMADPEIDTVIFAGGSHLIETFGSTINDLVKDGMPVDKKIDFLTPEADTPGQQVFDFGTAVQKFSKAFQEYEPECLFVVGDRWEMMPPVIAANMMNIPIIHHSGGDITQGSADNQTRYVLTILSHKHLVVLPSHKKRLEMMGEEKGRVVLTGEPALTELVNFKNSVDEFNKKFDLNDDEDLVLATFHPTSYDPLNFDEQIEFYISVLNLIDGRIILTAPNPDPGSDVFAQKLKIYCQNRDTIHYVKSLGTHMYYAAMDRAKIMVGNSSSGMWEAPSFGLPVINFGSRQKGREHGANVYNCPLDIDEAQKAINSVSSDAFVDQAKKTENPYVQKDCLSRILSVLKEDVDRHKVISKTFVDPLSMIDDIAGS